MAALDEALARPRSALAHSLWRCTASPAGAAWRRFWPPAPHGRRLSGHRCGQPGPQAVDLSARRHAAHRLAQPRGRGRRHARHSTTARHRRQGHAVVPGAILDSWCKRLPRCENNAHHGTGRTLWPLEASTMTPARTAGLLRRANPLNPRSASSCCHLRLAASEAGAAGTLCPADGGLAWCSASNRLPNCSADPAPAASRQCPPPRGYRQRILHRGRHLRVRHGA